MPSDYLYAKLAEALSRPSDAYLAAQEGLAIPGKIFEGYNQGAAFADAIRKRKLQQQTLREASGGTLPPELTGFGDQTVEGATMLAPAITAIASLEKATKNPMADWKAKYDLAEQGRRERQQRQQDFIRSIIGAKGNPQTVSEAQDAMKAADAMQSLNDDLDKLSPMAAKIGASPAAKIFAPSLAAKKSQILLYAGFSRGGKQLTGTELGVVVDALTPTFLDDKNSRTLKNKTFQDWAQGKIALSDAAKLLGPAGVPLMQIAQSQRVKQEEETKKALLGNVASGGADDLNSLFDAVSQ